MTATLVTVFVATIVSRALWDAGVALVRRLRARRAVPVELTSREVRSMAAARALPGATVRMLVVLADYMGFADEASLEAVHLRFDDERLLATVRAEAVESGRHVERVMPIHLPGGAQ